MYQCYGGVVDTNIAVKRNAENEWTITYIAAGIVT